MSRRALVTGAARGIGQSIAETLARDGFDVIAPSRAELDLASPESIEAWLGARSEPIDVLVNNAGVNPVHPLEAFPADEWRNTLEVDLTAPFLLIKGLAPAMAERGWGRIVNVSSAYAEVGRAGRAAYAAAKAGLSGLTRTAALEFAPHVLVNAVLPGFVGTELTFRNNDADQIAKLTERVPLARLAEPQEIAEHVAFLVSERNTYATGQLMVVDGGFLAG